MVYVVLLEFSSLCAFGRMPACCEDGVKPYLHKLPSDSSGMYPSIHEVLKLLLMEKYSCMDMLSNVMWHHPIQSEIKRFLFNLCRSMVKKDGLQILLHEVRSLEIFQVWLLNCRMGMSSPRVDEGHIINSSRNIRMCGPLLELRGGHMVVLQVEVLQVTLVRQLVANVSECFTFCPFAQNRGILCSLARVPSHLSLQKSSWIPCSSVAVWLEVQGLRHQWLDYKRFVILIFIW